MENKEKHTTRCNYEGLDIEIAEILQRGDQVKGWCRDEDDDVWIDCWLKDYVTGTVFSYIVIVDNSPQSYKQFTTTTPNAEFEVTREDCVAWASENQRVLLYDRLHLNVSRAGLCVDNRFETYDVVTSIDKNKEPILTPLVDVVREWKK